jgi:hypothetical protein
MDRDRIFKLGINRDRTFCSHLTLLNLLTLNFVSIHTLPDRSRLLSFLCCDDAVSGLWVLREHDELGWIVLV